MTRNLQLHICYLKIFLYYPVRVSSSMHTEILPYLYHVVLFFLCVMLVVLHHYMLTQERLHNMGTLSHSTDIIIWNIICMGFRLIPTRGFMYVRKGTTPPWYMILQCKYLSNIYWYNVILQIPYKTKKHICNSTFPYPAWVLLDTSNTMFNIIIYAYNLHTYKLLNIYVYMFGGWVSYLDMRCYQCTFPEYVVH